LNAVAHGGRKERRSEGGLQRGQGVLITVNLKKKNQWKTTREGKFLWGALPGKTHREGD